MQCFENSGRTASSPSSNHSCEDSIEYIENMNNGIEDIIEDIGNMKSEMEAEASAMAIAWLKILEEINTYEKMKQLKESKSISDNAKKFSDGIYLLSASLQRSLDIVFLELEELHITSVPPTNMPTTVNSTAAAESATTDELVTGSQKSPDDIMPGELIVAQR